MAKVVIVIEDFKDGTTAFTSDPSYERICAAITRNQGITPALIIAQGAIKTIWMLTTKKGGVRRPSAN